MRAPVTLGIVTRGRPDSLRACIESHVACARRFGRDIEVLVVDDSDDDDTRTFALSRALRREGIPVRWIGHEVREVLVDHLASCGASRVGATLAVTRTSRRANMTGAARNALLLLTVGQRLVLTDDDVVCAPDRDLERGAGEPLLSSSDDPTTTRLLASEEEIAPARDDVDVFGAYEAALAVPAMACVMPGLRGGSGIGLRYRRLLDGADELARAASYTALAESDLVHRAPTRTTWMTGAWGFGAHLGVDNRQPLPPFAPEGRNQDGVFFALRCRLLTQTLVTVLPFTMRHGPTAPMARDHIVDTAGCLRPNDFVVDRVLRMPITSRGASLEGRVGVLGRHLVALARSDGFEASFLEWLNVAHAEERDRVDLALARVDATRRPELAHDLTEIRARLQHLALAKAPDRDVLDAVHTQLVRVGALLAHWPVLRTAAARASTRFAAKAASAQLQMTPRFS
ncbi:MAG: hypothetical protein JST00_01705 [Deltaproteobacteria bacterium]|nr:hypothetical protein [Deltaproteobacteria bacterium]